MFKFKNSAEITAMTEEEAMKYNNEMASHLEKSIEDLSKANENNVTKEEMKTLKAEISELTVALKAQGLELAKRNAPIENKSTLEQIKEGLVSNLDNLKALKSGQKLQFDMQLKQVGTMTSSASLTGEIPQYQRLMGVNLIAQRNPFIGTLINSGSATSNVITWVYEVAGEGDADVTAEGVKKNQIDADFHVGTETVRKITAFIKVSEEMLEDVDFMASYINNKLLQRINLKIDSELLTGTAGGTNLNGIYTQATAWAAGAFAATITNSNTFDVLRTAINQVIVANHNPNYIVMHPTDVTAMGLSKDLQGQYLFPTFSMPNGQQIAGIPIVANSGMTIGKFLVMDGTKATAYFKNAVRIETGWESDDFVKNLRTILAEVRLALVIETNDLTAFVKGDISDAIAALEVVA